jgi:dTDP-4-dehydrorhamnose reductase
MRVLILGGSGMLGHRLWMDLCHVHDVWVTVRRSASVIPDLPGINRTQIREFVDAHSFDNIIRAFASIQPELVINCIGLVKQHPLCNDPLSVIELNARLPHQLSLICQTAGIRMIHISTDCVYSGKKGFYTEASPSDAEDLYGRSKYLGEVSYSHTFTLRTSIIGRELHTCYGLTEWFLRQRKSVKGYKRAIFSGFTTQAVAEILLSWVIPNPNLSGVWQIASQPISKFEVLSLMNEAYQLGIEIQPDETFACDRSLDCSRFCAETGFVPPSWPDMIHEMADGQLPYDRWKD